MRPSWIFALLLTAPACIGADAGKSVAFRTFLQGWNSAIDHTAIVFVRDQQEWESLWSKHSGNREPAPDLPAINFADSFVIAFFAGPRGSSGYEVAITRINEHLGKLSLEVDEKYPGRGCVALAVITRPFNFVTIPRRNGNWAFDFTLSRKETRCA
jgi:hypothetical protein